MNFKNLAIASAATLAPSIAVLGLPLANANVILTYTGNNFTSVTGVYTTSDKVTASITLANPLGNNLNLASVSPLSFTMNDGEQTLTQNNSLRNVQFSTDPTGVITNWDVFSAMQASIAPTLFNQIITSNAATPDGIADKGNNIFLPGSASNSGNPGTWTETTVSVPAPSIGRGLPALLAIGGAWILHIVFLRVRGKPVKAA
jgi:hypothetical protein